MSDKAIRDELAALREQVAALHSTRPNDPSQQEYNGPDSAPPKMEVQSAGEAERDSKPNQAEDAEGIEEQVQEFVSALEQEIKSTNPMTVLVIFSLGILIGRMLPR